MSTNQPGDKETGKMSYAWVGQKSKMIRFIWKAFVLCAWQVLCRFIIIIIINLLYNLNTFFLKNYSILTIATRAPITQIAAHSFAYWLIWIEFYTLYYKSYVFFRLSDFYLLPHAFCLHLRSVVIHVTAGVTLKFPFRNQLSNYDSQSESQSYESSFMGLLTATDSVYRIIL